MPKKDKDIEEREWRDADDSPHISFIDVEKSMTPFSGDDDYPISTWFEEFEDTAQLMNWSDIQKLIYAKRLLCGTAKLFLRSLGRVKDYRNLKNELAEEFRSKLNSAAIHKKLSSRKIKKDETLQQYFLHMKECALHGKIEDDALMEYVIDGITDSEYNKSVLYGASDLKEFRKKLDIYQHIKEKVQHRPNTYTQSLKNKTVKRCFKCGDLDHEAPTCTKGMKCFKCNEFGHKGTDCPSKTKITLNIRNNMITNIDKEDKEVKPPYKKVKVNDIEIIALIDTGSDVNLIKLTEARKIRTENSKYDEEVKIQLTGIAGKELSTEGLLNAKVMIDNYYTDIKFHVVKDNDISVNVILGNPILNDFEVNFTAEGIFLKKINHLTLLVEKIDTVYCESCPENKENIQKIEKMVKEYKPEVKKDTRLIVVPKKMQNEDIRRKCAKMKNLNEKNMKMIKEEGKKKVMNCNEKRDEIRIKAKESIKKIQEGNVRNYKRKKKTATEYKVNEQYAIKRVGEGDGPINTTSSTDLMKPRVDVKGDICSSGADE